MSINRLVTTCLPTAQLTGIDLDRELLAYFDKRDRRIEFEATQVQIHKNCNNHNNEYLKETYESRQDLKAKKRILKPCNI